MFNYIAQRMKADTINNVEPHAASFFSKGHH